VQVFIEIERGSDQKHELNKLTGRLELDRVTPQPYPYAYGFIPGTLAEDGDDLDALIVSEDAICKQGQTYTAHVVGALCMEDEKGMDEKVLCVLTVGGGADHGRGCRDRTVFRDLQDWRTRSLVSNGRIHDGDGGNRVGSTVCSTVQGYAAFATIIGGRPIVIKMLYHSRPFRPYTHLEIQ